MEKAKVYFTDMRTESMGKNLLQKLETLIRAAGIEKINTLQLNYTLESRATWHSCVQTMQKSLPML